MDTVPLCRLIEDLSLLIEKDKERKSIENELESLYVKKVEEKPKLKRVNKVLEFFIKVLFSAIIYFILTSRIENISYAILATIFISGILYFLFEKFKISYREEDIIEWAKEYPSEYAGKVYIYEECNRIIDSIDSIPESFKDYQKAIIIKNKLILKEANSLDEAIDIYNKMTQISDNTIGVGIDIKNVQPHDLEYMIRSYNLDKNKI